MNIQKPTRREVLQLGGSAIVAVAAAACAPTAEGLRNLADAIESKPFEKDSPAIELANLVKGYDGKNAEEKLKAQDAVYNHFAANSGAYEAAISAKALDVNGRLGTLGVQENGNDLQRIPLHVSQVFYLINGGRLPQTERKLRYEAPKGSPQKESIYVPSLTVPADTVTGENLVRIAQKLGRDFRVTGVTGDVAAARKVWTNFSPEVFLYGLRLREDADLIGFKTLHGRYKGAIPGSGIQYAQLTDGKQFNVEIAGAGNHAGIQAYTFKVPTKG